MKKAYLIGALVAVALAPAAMANTITVAQTPGAFYGQGGELTAATTPTAILGYSRSAGTFQTFCIETGVPIANGGTYTYTTSLSDHAGNSLKVGTAWLFSQFSTGTFSLYDYTKDAGNVTDAGELQAAIWEFQGQTRPAASTGVGFDPGTNPYYQAALLANPGTTGNADTGADGVKVLVLSTPNGSPAQDLLGISVPDGGTTMALLGFALVGIEGLRRKVSR